MIANCGCCGDGFSTKEQDPEHDEGFGVCPSCVEWMAERNEADWQRLEEKVAAALNETNRERFRAFDLGVRRGIMLKMIEEGIITWGIKRCSV